MRIVYYRGGLRKYQFILGCDSNHIWVALHIIQPSDL